MCTTQWTSRRANSTAPTVTITAVTIVVVAIGAVLFARRELH